MTDWRRAGRAGHSGRANDCLEGRNCEVAMMNWPSLALLALEARAGFSGS